MLAACVSLLLQTGDPFESRQPAPRHILLQRGGGTQETELAVHRALEWLSREQRFDGAWQASEQDYAIGVTGLSILAFLGAGHGFSSEMFGSTVRRGAQFLLEAQDSEGCVGDRGVKYMYGHLLATAALAEASGMGAPGKVRKAAQKAVDFLVASQNPGKGWRYSKRCGDNDTSVTGWAVMALRSAERVGLTFPKSAYAGALAWFDEASSEAGRTGYVSKNGRHSLIPGRGEEYDFHESLTALAVLGRFLIQKDRKDHRLAFGLQMLAMDLPTDGRLTVDFYYWHVGTLAMFEAGGADGKRWTTWNGAVQSVLLGSQVTAGDFAGSWAPIDRWTFDGGRVAATALNTLTLETYYRYVIRPKTEEK